jgi:hypothetical protein
MLEKASSDDLLSAARDALAFLRENGIPSHINDDVTEQLCASFEALDALLSGKDAVLPAAWIPFRKLSAPWYCESGVAPGRRQGCQCVNKPEPCDECVKFARKLEELKVEPSRPWVDNDKLVPELHSGGWEYDIRVRIGASNVVEIDKFYGSLVAQPVRISIEGGSWVVERMIDEDYVPPPGTSVWVEVARFPLDGEIPGAVQ